MQQANDELASSEDQEKRSRVAGRESGLLSYIPFTHMISFSARPSFCDVAVLSLLQQSVRAEREGRLGQKVSGVHC